MCFDAVWSDIRVSCGIVYAVRFDVVWLDAIRFDEVWFDVGGLDAAYRVS